MTVHVSNLALAGRLYAWSTGALAAGQRLLPPWGLRIGSEARAAIPILRQRFPIGSSWSAGLAAVRRLYGLDAAGSALAVPPFKWLRITEPNAVAMLAEFIRAGGTPRILAFLRALGPGVHWPTGITGVEIATEVPVSDKRGSGRIDLLISAQNERKHLMVVLEAKFGHHSKDNPFSTYASIARRWLQQKSASGSVAGELLLLIVAPAEPQRIAQPALRRQGWHFMSWQGLLRRFEIAHRGLPDDLDFRRFRRTLWDKQK